MKVLAQMHTKDHEQVVFCQDAESGLRAIIAIHNTVLGPALGGCRMWPYEQEEDALNDALRLSRGMTYKSAIANLPLGGGKSVIIGNSKTMKTPELFRAFGRFVQAVGGRYITAEDVGTSVKDMEWVHEETDFVTGKSIEKGGSGDPSIVTAFGVYRGILAALKWHTGSESLEGKRFAVQGVGNVGYHLVGHLCREGAQVFATDIDQEALKRLKNEFEKVEIVAPDAIYDVPCDVFAPCALGAVINENTVPRLRCEIVAGSANNVLQHEEKDCEALDKRGIVYVPDYVINAGGIINVAGELEGYNAQKAMKKADGIYETTYQILQIAKENSTSTLLAANTLAERRIADVSQKRRMYQGVSRKAF